MKTKTLPFFILLLVFATGLSAQPAGKYLRNAKRYYQAGNYLEASLQSIQALKIKTTLKPAQEILSNSYGLAMEYAMENIKELEAKCDPFAGDATLKHRKEIMRTYASLVELDRGAYEVSQMVAKPKYSLDFERRDVSAQLETAKVAVDSCNSKCAALHYDKGVELAAVGEMNSSRKAAHEFKTAEAMVPGYKDATDQYDLARKAGTIRVAVLPFENQSGNFDAGAIGTYLSNRIEADLITQCKGREFVEIVPFDQLNTLLANAGISLESESGSNQFDQYGVATGIHLFVTGQITQCVVQHKDPVSRGPRQEKGSVVVDYEYYTNSKGKRKKREIYGPVYASVTRYTRESVASINGDIKIITSATNQIHSTQAFQSDKTWSHCWLTYTGDKRAITWGGCTEEDAAPPANIKLINPALDMVSPSVSPGLAQKIQ